jgi:hypothetical protein
MRLHDRVLRAGDSFSVSLGANWLPREFSVETPILGSSRWVGAAPLLGDFT